MNPFFGIIRAFICHSGMACSKLVGLAIRSNTTSHKILAGFHDDIGPIDEENDVAVALLIQVNNGYSHNQDFTAANRHEKEHLSRDHPFLVAIEIVVHARQRLLLIRAQGQKRVQVVGD